MQAALIIGGLLIAGFIAAALALVGARVFKLDTALERLSVTRAARYEAFIGLLGLIGLGGALILLLGTGLSLAASTTGTAIILLACAGGLSLALTPNAQRAQTTQVAGRLQQPAPARSKAA